MFTHIKKAMLLAGAARSAIETLGDDIMKARDASQAPKKAKRPRKGQPFCHYTSGKPMLGPLLDKAGNETGAFRRHHVFMHATKGPRRFMRSIPAPLGMIPKPPGKLDRYLAARARGTCQ